MRIIWWRPDSMTRHSFLRFTDCCSSDAHGADSPQSLRRPRVTRETRCTFLLWCASSSFRRSSQCYRVREIPLRLRVDRVEHVTAKSHSRDAQWRYSGQCWPIADGLDRLKLREGPMYPTSWPPREQRRLNSAFFHCYKVGTIYHLSNLFKALSVLLISVSPKDRCVVPLANDH